MKQKNFKKKTAGIIAGLFMVSWCALAVLSMLYVGTKAKQESLKKALVILEQEINSLKRKQAEAGFADERYLERSALDFIEWQFVLKEQVNAAGGRLAEAIAKIKHINKNKGLVNLLYYNLGLNYTLAVNYQKAVDAYENALKFNKKDSASCYNLGLLYSTLRQPQKAVKYYKKYLKFAPESPNSEEIKNRIKDLGKK